MANYYARPYTWGFGVGYNPYVGWSLGYGFGLGWFHFGVGFGGGYWRGWGGGAGGDRVFTGRLMPGTGIGPVVSMVITFTATGVCI